MKDDHNRALRDDVRLLGTLLGETLIRQEGEELYRRVEAVRASARRARRSDPASGDGFRDLSADLATMPLETAVTVARAFSAFLHLANVAEQHHRVRRRRARQREPLAAPLAGSLDDALPRLAAAVPPDRLHDAVRALRIELVVTAHPTEMMRRTLQRKYASIAAALAERDRVDLTPRERQRVFDTLAREIAAAWDTDEVRDERPGPLDEVRAAFSVFERTIWHAVPEYLRSFDRALTAVTGRGLPVDAAPMVFGSWIGGDRDGNPFVTPEVTRRACLSSRALALTLYARDVAELIEDLSMRSANDALRATTPAAEPYRAVLRTLQRDLEATRRAFEDQLSTRPGGRGGARVGENVRSVADIERPLRLCYDSLHETGHGAIADGPLLDVLRRLACFGLSLARLDIRQEAARHTDAIDLIARQAGVAGFAEWDDEQRIAFLAAELAHEDEPAAGALPNNPRVADVVHTFDMLAALPSDSLGAYVITMASRASDVLAVEYLQRRSRVTPALRVVPLFETAHDLRAAGAIVDRLLSIPWYRARVAGAGDRQEIMIGYSDSAKDAGRVAAAWELYQAQEAIVAAGRRHGVAITIFHGRGGSIGRGGGPTAIVIQSQPPGSIDGTMRVTEQGEMIQAKFGLPGIAERTLEVYTTATLEAMLAPPSAPRPEWRAAMDGLAASAERAFREVVYEDAAFPRYFRAVTPEAEIDHLHIGSRPARRGGGGFAGLRAIPWHFAWMQTRLLLASWLGAERLDDPAARDTYRDMYREWPFFRSTIALLEIALGKADPRVAGEYDRRLAPAELRPLALALRGRLQRAIDAVLAITGRTGLLDDHEVLRRSIEVRNPYVDPINLVQVELLRRLSGAAGASQADALRSALRITISGVAAGMRNTG